MKVGILTFHASHNYGSMLQAYALQHTVKALGHECEIINFRTQRQRAFYRPFYHTKGLRPKLKALLYPRLAYADHCKHLKFEEFLKTYMSLSPNEYSTCEELSGANLDYDAYICGSDQIWNTICFDFDEAYLLKFVDNARKISYAPSMGPNVANFKEEGGFKNLVSQFDTLSVREDETRKILEQITGKNVEVVVDPALLLDAEAWNQLSGEKPLVAGEYIFFYTPWVDLETYHRAINIAKKLKMKLVVSMSYWYRQFHNNPNVEYRVNTGPREFVNLVKYSKMVIGASFHAVAFSIIFGKQFYAIDGMNDARISNILSQLSLERFAESPKMLLSDSRLSSIYLNVKKSLSDITTESKAFLNQALSH